ncbi:unnamed protein product [Mycena citricolor]|uniref:Uncharacterized protein n=1 Tax=Mycena citricolor TaxID=2018698 RepID=A0AAD2GSM9_9AGAR|nr:unnamed protein product [Mycena citricolor]
MDDVLPVITSAGKLPRKALDPVVVESNNAIVLREHVVQCWQPLSPGRIRNGCLSLFEPGYPTGILPQYR